MGNQEWHESLDWQEITEDLNHALREWAVQEVDSELGLYLAESLTIGTITTLDVEDVPTPFEPIAEELNWMLRERLLERNVPEDVAGRTRIVRFVGNYFQAAGLPHCGWDSEYSVATGEMVACYQCCAARV